MKKVLKKEFGLGRRSRFWIFLVLLAYLAASLTVFRLIHENIKETVMEEARSNVENISELNAEMVYRELIKRQTLLESIAVNLSENRQNQLDKIVERMVVYVEKYDFYHMGVLTPDGILRTTNEKKIDVSHLYPYQEALSGQPVISKSFAEEGGGTLQLNLLTEPVYFNGELQFILTATYRSRELAALLNTSSLNDGFSFILDSGGSAVIYPRTGRDRKYLELLAYISDSPEVYPSAECEYKSFVHDGVKYYAHFEKLNINDWYLMTCAREADVFRDAYLVMSSVFKGMAFLWVLIIVAVGFVIFLWIRYQKKTQKIVFFDKLLKEKNFEYLRILFPQLTQEEKHRIAFFALDVDKFKEFNFVYGREEGDQLLCYISRTFKEVLPEDRLYRYVADQFAGLISCYDQAEAEGKMNRLYARFAADIAGKKLPSFEISTGLCMLSDYLTLDTAYSDALIAKNTIKGNRVQKYAFYDEKMRKQRIEYMAMESEFQDALRNNEFQVYYQPKYDMRLDKIVGAEALVRWKKPDGTIISPAVFIPCFEASRQIVNLDEKVVEMVCSQMKEMQNEGIEIQPVSVNLSRVNLKYPGITKKLERMITSLEIDPANLAFEITESALYEDSIPMKTIVSNLHEMGCKVNMDDYGTGVSTLSTLANIEFDVLKLDKSFIDKIGDKKMEHVIRSTIRLAADLGMELIAEGVEEREQRWWLLKWGCWYAQGYYYSKPVTFEEYKKLLIEKGRRKQAAE